MIIFYLILQVGAVKVISNFPEVYLYANEKYYESITNYFSGTELDIHVNEKNSSDEFFFECSTKSSIQLSKFIDFTNSMPSSQHHLIAIENTYDYTILALNNDTVILLTLSKIDLSLNVTFNQTLNGKFPGVSIISGALTQYNIIILIESTEKVQNYSFTRNDILYAGYDENSFKISSSFWDLRYKEEILISTSDSNYIAFVVQDDGNEKGGIYVFWFYEPEYPILVQVIDKFEYVPINVYQDSFPQIKDLLIQNGFLLILTSDNLIIVFKLLDEFFVEQTYTNFTEFGQVNNLAHFKNVVNYIPVTANNSAVVYNVDLLSKLTFSSSRVRGAKVTYAQELAGFLFFSSTTFKHDAFFEIVSFSFNSTQNVTLINMRDYVENLNPTGSWIVAPTPHGYSLVRQDYDGIRLFKLSLPSYIFIVSSPNSVKINITASDIYSSISNTLTITIYNELGNIYPVFNYFQPKILQISYPVYFLNLSQSLEFNIYEVCSGWNLTYNIQNYTDDLYEYSLEPYKGLVDWKQVELNSDFIDAGFYGGILYLMDFQGNVYKDQTKLNISSNALAMRSLSLFSSNIAVLYSDFIMCYDSQIDIYSIVNLINPCEIFKVSEFYIICAYSNTVQILSCYQLIAEIILYTLDGPIKDIVFCENPEAIQNFIYILMDSKVYIYKLLEYELIYVRSKHVKADQIFCYFEHIALLTPSSIEIYTITLNYQLDKFNLYTNFTHIIMDQNILILQYQDSIYYYNILSTALNSLVSIYNIGPCSIKSSNSGVLLTNCTTYLNFFNSTCPPSCRKVSKLNFRLANIDNTTQGTHSIQVPISVSNGSDSQVFYITYDLFTYDSALFFDNLAMQYNYTYSYDIYIFETLKYYINGYNLDAVLLINDEIQNNSTVQPVSLVNRLTLIYNYTFDDTVNSYTIVPDTELKIFIINGAIIMSNNKSEPNLNFTHKLEDISGSCLFIEYVARTEKLALFVCYGSQNSTDTGNYYDGSVYEFTQVQPFFFFFSVDIERLEIMSFKTFYISFKPRLIKIVTGSQSEFLIISISSKSNIFQDFFNDDIIVYRCSWKFSKLGDNFVKIKDEVFINFYTLNLETFAVMSIDGIFNVFYDNRKTYNIYLYVADSSYGIRVLKIVEDQVFIVQEIQHFNNLPISLTVCSASIFVVTIKTSLIIYSLNSHYKLDYYVTYPESSVNKYIGLNSVSTCSSYYTPTYFSFYLQEKNNTNNYILRIISLTSDLNSSVHKDILISGFNNNLNRPTSLFKNQNTITFFSNNFETYEEYTLSDFALEFNSMNKSQYEQMKKNNMDKEKFNFTIKVFKDNNMSRTSKCFNLTRTGYSTSGVTSKEVDYIYLIVGCTAGVFLILVIISFCVYRRIMKRKKVKPEVSEARFKLQILSKRISSTYYMNSKY